MVGTILKLETMRAIFSVKTILGFVLVAGLMTSCKKKKSTEPAPDGTSQDAPTGVFMMHLHTYIGSTEVDAYNIVYTTDAGRKISLNMAQMYISDIELVKADGSIYSFGSKKLLKVFETETYLIGTTPVGNYKSIRFKVGLDATTNQLNPTTPSDSALLNKPAMWFGSTAQPDGYVFMNVSGSLDTTAGMTATNAQMVPFSYKIGTNANYKQVTMPDKNFSIVKDQVEYGHVLIDYSKLFNGFAINQMGNLMVPYASANSITPATIIVNNIPSMFNYEQ